MRTIALCILLLGCGWCMAANPVDKLLERIDRGASYKFKTDLTDTKSAVDFFELDQDGDKVVVRGIIG